MEAQQLTVEYEPTESLVPYARNAKIHTDSQIDQIAKSIQDFGFNDPVAVWTNAQGESEIIEGHGRVLAAQELGITELPVIHLDRLTDEQRRAYTHVHNQLTMNTGWDFDALEMDMEELDFDFTEFGFEVPNTDFDSENGSEGYDDLNMKTSVCIDCDDEGEAERIYNELTEAGYKCRVLTL